MLLLSSSGVLDSEPGNGDVGVGDKLKPGEQTTSSSENRFEDPDLFLSLDLELFGIELSLEIYGGQD